ncbi:MAG: hypothetical protein J6S98_08605 [Lentisphaeria bacterium]|nr:hypothetical protein [Lentisphaeria bacterium]
MLKKILLLAVLTLFSCNLFAHGEQFFGTGIIRDAKWTPLQISVWPVHLCSPRTDVYGLAVSPGLIGFGNRVYGISGGLIFFQGANYGVTTGILSCGVQNNALSLGVFNSWKKNNGVSIGVANFVHDQGSDGISRNTLQIGVFNQANSGLQIGLLNYNPNALIPWMPLINFVIPRSVESSLKELKERPCPFDYHIKKHANQYFPDWNTEERLRWLNELFPLTDAGATSALMAAAEKHGMIREWDDHALTLPAEQRKKLRYSLGYYITKNLWSHWVKMAPDGTCTLHLTNIQRSGRCSFSAKFKDLPENARLTVRRYNADLEVMYYDAKKSQNVTLFTVRRDAETDLWFETGSWEEVNKKTPAVTTYSEKDPGFVCTQIRNGEMICKTIRLKEAFRKIKLGSIEPDQTLQTPAW